MFYKIGAPINFATFTGICWRLFLIKLQAFRISGLFLKRYSNAVPLNTAKFLRTSFLWNTSGGCFWKCTQQVSWQRSIVNQSKMKLFVKSTILLDSEYIFHYVFEVSNKSIGLLVFFYKQRFFSAQPHCCLTSSWLELQMLLRCCLIHISIIILRHILYLPYLCPCLDLALLMSFLCDFFSFSWIQTHLLFSW